MRILQRVADARLRREVNDVPGRMVPEQALERRPIREIELCETETLERTELAQPRFFQPDVVVGVEVVQADDCIARSSRRLATCIPMKRRSR